MSKGSDNYDQAYFDKWYRNPRHRVKSASLLNRQVAFVLHTAEWVLGRPVRNVLDVGCGEGNWRAPLRKLRPALKYVGVDPSEYAVQRFGKSRNIVRGSIENLSTLSLDGPFDLVICCGMLNYVPSGQLRAGFKAICQNVRGMAYLEIFTNEDDTEGDTSWPKPQSRQWYKSSLKAAGLTSVGLHCYVREELLPIAELERAF